MLTALPTIMATKDPRMNGALKLCFGKVNIDTPTYENMKFSAIKLSNPKNCLVMVRDSFDKLL